VEQAARAAYVASVTAGVPLSQRAIADRFGLSRRKAAQLVTAATVQANGHDPRRARPEPEAGEEP
jgi:DNA-binding transcriptional regulator LsrR (DeoR family)